MEIIILAGGFGTRLAHIVSDVPKPMALVGKAPFLVYILENLRKFNITKVIIATGHKSEVIEKYFGNDYKGVKIIYSVEREPLDTGGAIKKALGNCENDSVVVLNGDTLFDVNLDEMQDFHNKEKSKLTVAIKKMLNFDRYGTVDFEGFTILGFSEKKPMKEGYINGGVYILQRKIFDHIRLNKFSLEKDYMEKYVSEGGFNAFISDGYFIDIGIPEDYYKASKELKL